MKRQRFISMLMACLMFWASAQCICAMEMRIEPATKTSDDTACCSQKNDGQSTTHESGSLPMGNCELCSWGVLKSARMGAPVVVATPELSLSIVDVPVLDIETIEAFVAIYSLREDIRPPGGMSLLAQHCQLIS